MSKKERRRRVFADLKIQGGLCLRVAIYWVVCQLAVIGTIAAFAALESPEASNGPVTRFFAAALSFPHQAFAS